MKPLESSPNLINVDVAMILVVQLLTFAGAVAEISDGEAFPLV